MEALAGGRAGDAIVVGGQGGGDALALAVGLGEEAEGAGAEGEVVGGLDVGGEGVGGRDAVACCCVVALGESVSRVQERKGGEKVEGFYSLIGGRVVVWVLRHAAPDFLVGSEVHGRGVLAGCEGFCKGSGADGGEGRGEEEEKAGHC